QDNHLAMFPEELPKRLIKMFAFVGDTVLDPFTGSGTTNLAAKNLGRNSIGYEINYEYIPIIKQRLKANQRDIHDTTFEFLKQKNSVDFEKEIQKLPYIFKDPHTLDKKVDPKKLQFGSKIDKNGNTKREELYTVKEIISPEKIKLSNDLTIKLLGIKDDPSTNGKATSFLSDKTNGKRVFIKYDNVKYDKENNLLCYLYLENKTFINAHLIKNGLVQVDSDIDYKYKDKFLNLLQQNNGKRMDFK
ncbi:MAG: thermonuclease family protein, partial [Bacteroidia bacterium]|nr:thermonuclease family protein [Bacteroidia bacterium]